MPSAWTIAEAYRAAAEKQRTRSPGGRERRDYYRAVAHRLTLISVNLDAIEVRDKEQRAA